MTLLKALHAAVTDTEEEEACAPERPVTHDLLEVEPMERKLDEGSGAGAAAGGHGPRITPQTRMGEIITRWPHAVDLLVASGFAPLADPAHREMVKGLPVTLEMACAKHGIDLGEMLASLNAVTGD